MKFFDLLDLNNNNLYQKLNSDYSQVEDNLNNKSNYKTNIKTADANSKLIDSLTNNSYKNINSNNN